MTLKYINQSKEDALTYDNLRASYDYDPETGVFTLKKLNGCGRMRIGDKVGTIDKKGYHVIQVNGYVYKAHRMAYLYMTGSWPENVIDHINGIRSDNRWCNLRDATHGQNRTYSKLTKNNTSGKSGVSKRTYPSGKVVWGARINVMGKETHLGFFSSFDEAVEVRKEAERKYYPDFESV